ncbi:hypothetical protein K440DRAFT_639149 [Wilcoxina mikolae CBS 423.85]|nr:hypothetical protein K440DRAFT_639149 [Wilcoxina mikolae CBS 423.85]
MLASKILRRGALPAASRPFANFKARALHISSGSQFRRASIPLSRVQLAPSLTAVRFNSTAAPSSTPPPAATSPPSSTGFLDSFTDTPLSSAADAVQPGTMGYLHSLGIDFGWGTSTMIQTLLESIHVYGGLPWWGAIMASVLLVRTIQFPFYCKMSSNTARMKEANPLLAPITKQLQAAQKRSDTAEMLRQRQEMQNMLKIAGVDRRWLLFPITQIPIFYGFYKTLREMSELKVPALTTDGLGWFTDLSVADPTYILPAAASALVGLQIYFGGESGATSMAKSVKTALTLGLPVITFTVASGWPAALAFYLLTSTTFGVLQTALLKNEKFREAYGLYPMTEAGSQNPLPIKGGINALNIASPGKTIDVTPKKKQIGAAGGFLDQLTGGKDEEGSVFSLKKFKETSKEKQKEALHKKYEERRKQRIEEEKKVQQLEKERRNRMKQK